MGWGAGGRPNTGSVADEDEVLALWRLAHPGEYDGKGRAVCELHARVVSVEGTLEMRRIVVAMDHLLCKLVSA